MTRNELATILENEAHNTIAEHIRAGVDPVRELGDGRGGLRKALRTTRYADAISRHAQATFQDIVSGALTVSDEVTR